MKIRPIAKSLGAEVIDAQLVNMDEKTFFSVEKAFSRYLVLCFRDQQLEPNDLINLAKKFVKAGCTAAGYSLESGNAKILKAMDKKVESHYFEEQVKICREAGLRTNTSLIIGYPQETKETIKETMLKLEKLKVYPSTGFLLPLPETGMWDYAIKNGFIKDIDNYLTSITINFIFLCLVLPSLYFANNSFVCKYWFFSLILVYCLFYIRLYRLTKN